MLGLKLAGKSENYGTEQEHLNNVFGVRLRISSLFDGDPPLSSQGAFAQAWNVAEALRVYLLVQGIST